MKARVSPLRIVSAVLLVAFLLAGAVGYTEWKQERDTRHRQWIRALEAEYTAEPTAWAPNVSDPGLLEELLKMRQELHGDAEKAREIYLKAREIHEKARAERDRAKR